VAEPAPPPRKAPDTDAVAETPVPADTQKSLAAKPKPIDADSAAEDEELLNTGSLVQEVITSGGDAPGNDPGPRTGGPGENHGDVSEAGPEGEGPIEAALGAELADDELDQGSLLDGEVEADGQPRPRGRCASASAAEARRPLPVLLPTAQASTRAFADQVQRALERVNVEDSDDSAILESLLAKLNADATLSGLRPTWAPPIEAGIARARLLQNVGTALRQFGKAFADATYDKATAVFRNVDVALCRDAVGRVQSANPAAMDVAFNVAGVGLCTPTELGVFCDKSHAALLAGRRFPPVLGKPALRAQLRALYQKAFPGARVRRVTIDGTWVSPLAFPDRKTLRGIVGVERKLDPRTQAQEDRCVMQEVVATQERVKRRWRKKCCEIVSTLAISCKALR
jgi:hypothetical protein